MQPGDLGLVRFIKYRYEKMKLFFFIFVYACGDSYTVNFRHPGFVSVKYVWSEVVTEMNLSNSDLRCCLMESVLCGCKL